MANCPKKKLLILFLSVHVNAIPADGTAIVIVITPNTIFAASDSKNSGGGNEHICKTFKTGSIYWSMSGVLGPAGFAHYYVPTIVKKSYVPGRDVANTMVAFRRNVRLPLQNLLESMRLSRPGLFEIAQYHPLEIAFWQFEDGRPVVLFVTYKASVVGNRVSLMVESEGGFDCRKINCATQTNVVFLGTHEEIRAYANSHPSWTLNPAQSASYFVNLEVASHPDVVGYPINDLAIHSDNSSEWASPNEVCHGIPQNGLPPPPLSYTNSFGK